MIETSCGSRRQHALLHAEISIMSLFVVFSTSIHLASATEVDNGMCEDDSCTVYRTEDEIDLLQVTWELNPKSEGGGGVPDPAHKLQGAELHKVKQTWDPNIAWPPHATKEPGFESQIATSFSQSDSKRLEKLIEGNGDLEHINTATVKAKRAHAMLAFDSLLTFSIILLGASVFSFAIWSFLQNPDGEAVPDPTKQCGQIWTLIVPMCMASFVSNALISLIAPIVPLHLKSLNVNMTWSGLLFTAPSLTVLLFSPFCPILNVKFGRATMVKCGLLTQAVTALVFGHAKAMYQENASAQLGVFLVCRVVEGMGSAATNIGMNSLVVAALPDGQIGKAMGLTEAMVGAGFSLGPPIGGFIYESSGFAMPFIAASIGFILSATASLWLPDTGVTSSSTVGPVSPHLSWRLCLIAGIAFCGTFIFGLVEPTYAVHGKETLKLSVSEISGMLALLSIAYSLSAPLIGVYVSNSRRLCFMSFSTCLAAMGVAFLGIAPAIPGLEDTTWHTAAEGVFIIIMGIGQAGILVPALPAMKDTLPKGSPKSATDVIATIFTSALTLGLVVGPLLGAFLTASMGYSSAMTVCGVALLTYGVICSVFLTIVPED